MQFYSLVVLLLESFGNAVRARLQVQYVRHSFDATCHSTLLRNKIRFYFFSLFK